jgi:hypothetical protein
MSAIRTPTCSNFDKNGSCKYGARCRFLHILRFEAPPPVNVSDYDFDEDGPLEELLHIKTRLPELLRISHLEIKHLKELGDIYETVCDYLLSEDEVVELARDIYSTFKMDEWTSVEEPTVAPAAAAASAFVAKIVIEDVKS